LLLAFAVVSALGVTAGFNRFTGESEEEKALATLVEEQRAVRPSAYLRLGPDGYLYVNSGIPLGAGLYCANLRTKSVQSLIGGYIKILNIIQSPDGNTVLLLRTGGGRKGVGWTNFSAFTVSEVCKSKTNRLINYSWDMESGMCGRSESLGIEKAGDVIDYKIGLDPLGMPQIAFSVQEQQCPDGDVIEKVLKYTYDGEGFSPDV
jgi:limonene-1,2-epoxide hydrolase